MQELLLSSSGSRIEPIAYRRQLTNAQFSSYATISSLSGISAGILINEGSGWLEFELDGKTLILAKKNIRTSISWDQINAAGCVFGTKHITIQGKIYKVRLLKCLDGMATSGPVFNGWDTYPLGTRESEVARLLYPILNNDLSLPIEVRNPEAPFTVQDLEVGTPGDGSMRVSWGQERTTQNFSGYIPRYIYGGLGSGYFYHYGSQWARPESGPQPTGWRPCLELI